MTFSSVRAVPDLVEMGRTHGTDKLFHDYLRQYDRWLRPLRDEPILLYEIGVAEGASLRLWNEFLPRARIVGIDNQATCAQYASGRICVEIGDQKDPAFLDRVIAAHGTPQVVIDDGAHTDSAIIATVEHLFPKVRPGGMYFVEDLHASYIPQHRDHNVSAAMHLADLVHSVNLHGRCQTGSYRAALGLGPMDHRLADVGDRDAHLSVWERSLESMHFYQSLCVLVRRQASVVDGTP